MPYISVIIPCYNVEAYINRCMDTLMHQTIGIENLEIILVNDASQDGTLNKLKEWESQYPNNIMVITYEENLRQGGARNIGIQYASADYIGFVDADDWIELDMFETLYRYAQQGNYDMVRGKFIREHYAGEHEITNENGQNYEYQFEKCGDWYCHDVKQIGVIGEYGGIWTSIYRKEPILENEIWFPEHVVYEDNFWGNIVNLYMRNLYIVDKIVYHYFINPSSTVTTRNALHHLDRLQTELLKVEEYQKRGAFDCFYRQLESDFIQLFYLNTLFILFTRFDYIPDVFNNMKESVLYYFPNYKENLELNNYNKREQLLLQLLEIPGELSMDDLERIKKAYLMTFR